jgi:hypothetical protein
VADGFKRNNLAAEADIAEILTGHAGIGPDVEHGVDAVQFEQGQQVVDGMGHVPPDLKPE